MMRRNAPQKFFLREVKREARRRGGWAPTFLFENPAVFSGQVGVASHEPAMHLWMLARITHREHLAGEKGELAFASCATRPIPSDASCANQSAA